MLAQVICDSTHGEKAVISRLGLLVKRGQKIEAMDFESERAAMAKSAAETDNAKMADSKTGQLRLRVVDPEDD